MNKTKKIFSKKSLFGYVKRNLPTIVFILIAASMGGVFIRNVGPLASPDSDMHYENSIAVATGQWMNPAEISEEGKRNVNISIPQKWSYVKNECTKNDIVQSLVDRATSSDGLLACEKREAASLSDSQIQASIRSQYPFINWLPQGIGLKIGMVLDLSPPDAQQLARVFNLLVYIIIFAAAIRFVPRGKWLLVFIGVLPQSVFIASSISSDTINIAWCALFITYVLKLFAAKKPLKKPQLVALVAIGIVLFWLKVAYAPLWLLILALKRPILKTSLRWIIFASVLIFGMTTYALWSHFFSQTAVLPVADNNLSIMINHLPQVAWSLIVNSFNAPFAILGNDWTVIEPGVFWILIIAMMIYISRKKLIESKTFFELLNRYGIIIYAVLAWLISLGLTFAALMLTWTDLSINIMQIDGFQARYILPILPLFLTIFFLPVREEPVKRSKNMVKSRRNEEP